MYRKTTEGTVDAVLRLFFVLCTEAVKVMLKFADSCGTIIYSDKGSAY